MVRQTLIDSIEALKNEDFIHPGFTSNIYLDPDAERIYTFLDTGGNSQPMDAFHRIDRHILEVLSGAIANSVYEVIDSIKDYLDELIDNYEGTEWDGSNHIGQWTEEASEILDMIHFTLPYDSIAYYWDARDWFSAVLTDLKEEWKQGKTAEEIITIDDCSSDGEIVCDRGEAIEWLKGRIAEWEGEEE